MTAITHCIHVSVMNLTAANAKYFFISFIAARESKPIAGTVLQVQ